MNTGMTVILAKEHHVILAKILCHLIERGALAITAAHPNVVIEIDQRRKFLAAGRWFLCFGARTLRQEHCRACQCDVTKSFHRLKLLSLYLFKWHEHVRDIQTSAPVQFLLKERDFFGQERSLYRCLNAYACRDCHKSSF